jgi:glycosyltransferase involved in cell wall biosynthesis
VKVLLIDNGQEFNINTPYEQPLGGSETSILLLAKGLQDLNNQVILLCNTQKYFEDTNFVIQSLSNEQVMIDSINQSDVIILNRIEPSYFLQFNKPIYYYAHDNFDQQQTHWLSTPLNQTIKILCVSEYQKQTFINYFKVPEKNLFVLGNSIDTNLYMGYELRNLNRLIFASIPYKGIEVLNTLFNDLCVRTKKDLELHIYSSMELYNRPNDEYTQIFNELQNTKGIFVHDVVSMGELSRELMKSSMILFPNTYPETFSMLCTEAQASGCIPISTNMGAMNERIKNNVNGYLTKGINIDNRKVYEEFIEKIIKVLNEDHYKMRISCEKEGLKYNYIKIARKFREIIEENNGYSKSSIKKRL